MESDDPILWPLKGAAGRRRRKGRTHLQELSDIWKCTKKFRTYVILFSSCQMGRVFARSILEPWVLCLNLHCIKNRKTLLFSCFSLHFVTIKKGRISDQTQLETSCLQESVRIQFNFGGYWLKCACSTDYWKIPNALLLIYLKKGQLKTLDRAYKIIASS